MQDCHWQRPQTPAYERACPLHCQEFGAFWALEVLEVSNCPFSGGSAVMDDIEGG